MGERGNDGSKREFLKTVAGVAAVAAGPRAEAPTRAGGAAQGRCPRPTRKVLEPRPNRYRWDPKTQKLAVAAGDVNRPNGLAFSPDESKLYIIEAGATPRIVKLYDVVDAGTRLSNGRVFLQAETGGTPDGFRLDVDGNLWMGWGMGSEALDGVNVFNSEAKLIGRIELPERCANLCFGGLHRNRLFMAASTSVYSLYVNTQGAPGG